MINATQILCSPIIIISYGTIEELQIIQHFWHQMMFFCYFCYRSNMLVYRAQ